LEQKVRKQELPRVTTNANADTQNQDGTRGRRGRVGVGAGNGNGNGNGKFYTRERNGMKREAERKNSVT
jgi:hypothetical protein